MRGKAIYATFMSNIGRITPAYAGKSMAKIQFPDKGEDHPCVCGEKQIESVWETGRPGSPLRMRGKGKQVNYIFGKLRITPAYAGKSLFTLFVHQPFWDHPCVCGEKRNPLVPLTARMGSPLRMRGKARKYQAIQARLGITPAYAGKSPCLWRIFNLGEDHPCVCGEKFPNAITILDVKGSPLRMRGKEIEIRA